MRNVKEVTDWCGDQRVSIADQRQGKQEEDGVDRKTGGGGEPMLGIPDVQAREAQKRGLAGEQASQSAGPKTVSRVQSEKNKDPRPGPWKILPFVSLWEERRLRREGKVVLTT